MGRYDTGQACLNGHQITGNIQSSFGGKFCPDCGQETISACPSCGTHLRGTYSEGLSVRWRLPAHCFACGAGFPWTAAKLSAAQELADAVDELTGHERETLAELMPHLVQETARTAPAGFKVAAILARLSGPAKGAFKSLLHDIAIEAGKKALGF